MPHIVEAAQAGHSRLRSDCTVATTAPSSGKTMIYLATGRAIGVRLERLPAAVRLAFWFNPRRGTWHRDGAESAEPVAFASDLRAGAGAPAREFRPPASGGGEDWGLVLATEKLWPANPCVVPA